VLDEGAGDRLDGEQVGAGACGHALCVGDVDLVPPAGHCNADRIAPEEVHAVVMAMAIGFALARFVLAASGVATIGERWRGHGLFPSSRWGPTVVVADPGQTPAAPLQWSPRVVCRVVWRTVARMRGFWIPRR
jgi:hypothetical protein